jgi:hypothetical protein
MKFRFVVEVEVNRVQGKFAAADELEAQIQDALESADPGSYEGENGGEYETSDWSVNAEAEAEPIERAFKRSVDELAETCTGLLSRLSCHQNVHCMTVLMTVLAEDVDAMRAALAKVQP